MLLRGGIQLAAPVLGILGLAWSLSVFPAFWFSADERVVASQIQARGSFKLATLADLASHDEAAGRLFVDAFPQKRWSAAFVRYAMVELAFDSFGAGLDQRIEDAQAAIRASLQLTPVDPYFLFAAYSLKNTQTGYDKSNLKLLDASYSAGPREGWVSLMRNQLALAVFSDLNAVTQQLVLNEFAAMVEAGLLDDAGRSLVSGWSQRDRLLASLEKVNPVERERFARNLLANGVRVTVPGVTWQQDRPWK